MIYDISFAFYFYIKPVDLLNLASTEKSIKTIVVHANSFAIWAANYKRKRFALTDNIFEFSLEAFN